MTKNKFVKEGKKMTKKELLKKLVNEMGKAHAEYSKKMSEIYEEIMRLLK